MGQVEDTCSILLALRDRDLAFCLITLLIVLHSTSVTILTISARRQSHKMNSLAYMTISLKDVSIIETVIWLCSLLFSGCFIVYRHVVSDNCEEVMHIISSRIVFHNFAACYSLSSSFVDYLNDLYRFVFPMRDAAVRAYPCLRTILPEYAMVPPPPVPRRFQTKPCMFSHLFLSYFVTSEPINGHYLKSVGPPTSTFSDGYTAREGRSRRNKLSDR
ncbi:unnamed protein product [Strongylus vulgaris]|uniref:Uncharacterized protein n=1 Tax=Strongylus vulgaris TaxID=40348 RepID=A0A3P7J809_STRVU|nr:unnamed protein product [Strongylus vulgaris]